MLEPSEAVTLTTRDGVVLRGVWYRAGAVGLATSGDSAAAQVATARAAHAGAAPVAETPDSPAADRPAAPSPVPDNAARGVAVIVHGFAASADDPGICQLAAQLCGDGLDVLVYDARGHGASEGHCSVGSEEHLDVAAAAELGADPGLPVVLIGISMGAVAVVRYLADEPMRRSLIQGAVLVSGPASWRMRPSIVGLLTAGLTRTSLGRKVAASQLGVRIAPGWRIGESPESMLRRVNLRVAVVHGAKDRLLSSAHGSRLHRSAGGPAILDIVADMGHGVRNCGWPQVVRGAQWVLGAERAPRPPLATAAP